MAVFVTRNRTLGVRLSEEEYLALEGFCARTGARCLSDVARSAIARFVGHLPKEEEIAPPRNQSARVKRLEEQLAKLSALVAAIKTDSREAGAEKATREISDRGL